MIQLKPVPGSSSDYNVFLDDVIIGQVFPSWNATKGAGWACSLQAMHHKHRADAVSYLVALHRNKKESNESGPRNRAGG